MPFATVNQHTIQYVESGQLGFQVQEDKLPIVCVHGLGSSQNYYMPVVPYLEGHRVVALSTYGAAGSKSQGEKLSLVDMAEDVVGLMDHLNIPKAIVVGHSMGGPMVLTAAARHPDRFAGVVAIGPVNPSSVKPEVFQTRIETVLKGDNSQFFKPVSRRYVLTFFLVPDGMEPLANTVPKAATGSNSTPLQRAFIRELILSQDPKSYASHCEAIINMEDPGFSSMTTPVLILAGDEDQSAPLAGCQSIHDSLGSEVKELKVYSKVGHWHCIEAGEDVGKDISAFASKLA